MLRVVVFVLSACVCNAAESKARTVEEDNTGLIQAAIMTKAEEAKASQPAAVVPKTEPRQHPHCQGDCDINGDDTSTCFSKAQPQLSSDASEGNNIIDEVSPSLTQEKAAAETASPPVKMANSGDDAAVPALVLRRSLTVLIALLALDGLRRWLAQDDAPKQKGGNAAPAAEKLEDKFMSVALRGDAAAGEALLAKGLAVDQADVWGSTLLHAAAKGGSTKLVSLLLQRGAKVDALDAWDETPLHLAAQSGWNEICDMLLAFGAGIDSRNLQGLTPLVVAAEQGKDDTFKLLLSRAASIPEGDDFDRLPPLLQELLSQQRVYSNEQHEAEMQYDLGEESDYTFDNYE